MIIIKKWLLSKNNNKRYKKQQFLKALACSYLNRKKNKLSNNKKFKKIYLINNIVVKSIYNININWLLKK